MRRSRIHREEVQRSKPEAMPPDGHRSEGTLSLSEVPYAGGSLFGYFFAGPALRRLEKVTRRKGGTVISNPRSNGYAHKPKPKPKPKSQTNKNARQSRASCIDLINERGK